MSCKRSATPFYREEREGIEDNAKIFYFVLIEDLYKYFDLNDKNSRACFGYGCRRKGWSRMTSSISFGLNTTKFTIKSKNLRVVFAFFALFAVKRGR